MGEGAGHRGVLIFCAQHCAIERVRPAHEIHQEYADALAAAIDVGVEVYALGCRTDFKEFIADRQIERGHLPSGREVSHSGTRDLPFGKDSITGYTMIKAENLDEAEKVVEQCPIVASTRVYEIMGG